MLAITVTLFIQVEMLEGPRWLVEKYALDFTLRDTDSKLVL